MNKQSGFTLMELAIIVAIISIVSAIAVPNLVGSISRGRVKAAARDIVTMIQRARNEAVKQNELVVVTFDSDGDGTMNSSYLAYVDDGQGSVDADANGILDGAANWAQDGTERTVYAGVLPAGVTIAGIPLGAGAGETRFNSRAMAAFGGPIALTNSRGYTVTINLGTGGIPTI